MKRELANAQAEIQILKTRLRILEGKMPKSPIRIRDYGHGDLYLPGDEHTYVSFGDFDISIDDRPSGGIYVRCSGRSIGGSCILVRPEATNVVRIFQGDLNS